MKYIFSQLRVAVIATLGLTVILSGLYPLAVWAVSQVAFHDKAGGSLIRHNGQIVGSKLLAQPFTDSTYFHPRPSSAGAGYDAANSSGSNLGPTSQKLMTSVEERVKAYRDENGLSPSVLIPGDAVTASGSGLDPHISIANARLQAPRVARARGISQSRVRTLIDQTTDHRQFGILGDPGVNVLRLNLALDQER